MQQVAGAGAARFVDTIQNSYLQPISRDLEQAHRSWFDDDGAGIVELYGVILPICVIDELDNTKYTGSDRTSRPRRPGNQSVASVQRRPVPGQRCYLAGWHDARDLRDRQTSDS